MQPYRSQPVSVPHPAAGPTVTRPGSPPRGPVRPAVPPGAPILDYRPRKPRQKRSLWTMPFWPFLVVGYSTFGRSFAYLGVPPLFIGELYLGVSAIQNRGNWIGRFINDVLKMRFLPLAIMLTILWGLFEVARPVIAGGSLKECLRTCAFNYYPILIIIGIAIGREMTLQKFIDFWKWYAIFYAIYSVLYAAFGLTLIAPWRSDTYLMSPPSLAAMMPVTLMALWSHLRGWVWKWILLPMSMIPIFFSSGRGAVLGLLIGVFVVAATSLRRFVLVMGLMTMLVLIMTIIGPAIEGEAGRAENLHPMINFARLIATFDEDTAYRMLVRMKFYAAADDMIVAKGTAGWRKEIWWNIMRSLNTTTLQALGHGHGMIITELTPDGQEIHTPHNFVFYALYYTGAIGLFFFALMLLALLIRTRRIPEPNIRALQTAHLLMMVLVAAVGNMFETPIAAIPFYLLSGIMIGLPLQATWRRYA